MKTLIPIVLFCIICVSACQSTKKNNPLTFAKNMPHYKSCASGNNSERDRCTRQMFDRKIREAFVYPDIALKMGL